jgi:hypothetical protein
VIRLFSSEVDWHAASGWRPGLRPDCSAVLGPCSARKTRFVRHAHCAQTVARDLIGMGAAAPCCKPLCSSTPATGPLFGSLRIALESWRDGVRVRHADAQRGVWLQVPSADGEERRLEGQGAPAPLKNKLRAACLSVAALGRAANSARAPQAEHRSEPLAQPGATLPGRLSLPPFFGEAKKGGRPSGRNPDAPRTLRPPNPEGTP